MQFDKYNFDWTGKADTGQRARDRGSGNFGLQSSGTNDQILRLGRSGGLLRSAPALRYRASRLHHDVGRIEVSASKRGTPQELKIIEGVSRWRLEYIS